MIEESYSFEYGEGNEIKVSLSSFTEEQLPDELGPVLGSYDIVQITIERTQGTEKTSLPVLLKIAETIGKKISDSPDSVFYYMCDTVNPIPRQRFRKVLLKPEDYRERLFNKLFQKARKNINAKEIENYHVNVEDESTHIHFIFSNEKRDVVMKIEQYIKEIEQTKCQTVQL